MGKLDILRDEVLDRIKVLRGPRIQTYGETRHAHRTKCETEPRSCMVLELKPMGKLNTLRAEVLDRTKALHGPQT